MCRISEGLFRMMNYCSMTQRRVPPCAEDAMQSAVLCWQCACWKNAYVGAPSKCYSKQGQKATVQFISAYLKHTNIIKSLYMTPLQEKQHFSPIWNSKFFFLDSVIVSLKVVLFMSIPSEQTWLRANPAGLTQKSLTSLALKLWVKHVGLRLLSTGVKWHPLKGFIFLYQFLVQDDEYSN